MYCLLKTHTHCDGFWMFSSESCQRIFIFLLSKISKLILGPTQPLVSGYQNSFLWMKGMGHDTDLSPPPVCRHDLSYLYVREWNFAFWLLRWHCRCASSRMCYQMFKIVSQFHMFRFFIEFTLWCVCVFFSAY